MDRNNSTYALVSMPWFWAYMPSIQLAIVKDLLANCDIEADVFEFYTDLLDPVGPNLYKALANDSGFVGELVFSQLYFKGHRQQWNEKRKLLGLADKSTEDNIFSFITPIVEQFVKNCIENVNWAAYSVVCFTLTATQTSASMLLAKLIKEKHPTIRIVFGGTSCSGSMGCAIAEICPAVDVVVHSEAESSIPALVMAFQLDAWLGNVPGITWRKGQELITNGKSSLHRLDQARGYLDFDAYFERIQLNGAKKWFQPWIPFESSRGCWYGEKVQCTFCGLNEIIQYRERGSGGLMDELEYYERKHDVNRFFATDLIMPRSFFKTLLPQIQEKKHDWTVFYEIKSNLKRREVEQLSKGKVSWIQPGIESLDDLILEAMKKGVSAAQNLQSLKWCNELGIQASWNLITGFPNISADSYVGMASLFPKIVHLRPPAGLGKFEVHRFSPYFEQPSNFGIRLLGADRRYSIVFPIAQSILDNLVYRYEYELELKQDESVEEALKELHLSVESWWGASRRNARFDFCRTDSNSIQLFDTRANSKATETFITGEDAQLFEYFDQMRPLNRFVSDFRELAPDAYSRLGGTEGIMRRSSEWERKSYLVRLSGHIMGLAVKIPAIQNL